MHQPDSRCTINQPDECTNRTADIKSNIQSYVQSNKCTNPTADVQSNSQSDECTNPIQV